MIAKLETILAGWPDSLLTVGLIAAALVAIATAMFAPALAKAAVLAWMVAP